MDNELFETEYTNLIEPLYGSRRMEDLDDSLLEEECENVYTIPDSDRMDFTHLDIYNIDPENCNDVDDAFSIYMEEGTFYLAIHIADPTDYISLQSKLWKDIVNRVTTKYPTNREPISLLPKKLVNQCSLYKNNVSNEKKAITVRVEMDKNTFNVKGEPELFFSKVHVKAKNCYSYKSAAKEKTLFLDGIRMMEQLKMNRSKQTKTTKLSDVSLLKFYFHHNSIMIDEHYEDEKRMKEMIAEFAIFANSFIGRYLKENLDDAIFRSCDSSNLEDTIAETTSGNEILYQIITNGISGKYNCKDKRHDLIGTDFYSHFTSPIRRLSDLICHYFLKYIHLKNVPSPFSKEEILYLTEKCLLETKNDKKIQYEDTKFRTLQIVKNLLNEKKSVQLEFFCFTYTGLFLNLIISKVNEYSTHISYTLRIPKTKREYVFGKKEKFVITKMNCFEKYDENTFPELDDYLFSSFGVVNKNDANDCSIK
jgi:exoribonuclease R